MLICLTSNVMTAVCLLALVKWLSRQSGQTKRSPGIRAASSATLAVSCLPTWFTFSIMVKFTAVILFDCGLPSHIDYGRDPVFAQIVEAETLKQALQEPRSGQTPPSVIIAATPVSTENLKLLRGLEPATKSQLQRLGVDKHMLQSAVANAPYYKRLFQTLNDKGIKYDKCQLLEPLRQIHGWLLNDDQLLDDIDKLFADIATAAGGEPNS